MTLIRINRTIRKFMALTFKAGLCIKYSSSLSNYLQMLKPQTICESEAISFKRDKISTELIVVIIYVTGSFGLCRSNKGESVQTFLVMCLYKNGCIIVVWCICLGNHFLRGVFL